MVRLEQLDQVEMPKYCYLAGMWFNQIDITVDGQTTTMPVVTLQSGMAPPRLWRGFSGQSSSGEHLPRKFSGIITRETGLQPEATGVAGVLLQSDRYGGVCATVLCKAVGMTATNAASFDYSGGMLRHFPPDELPNMLPHEVEWLKLILAQDVDYSYGRTKIPAGYPGSEAQ